MPRARCKTVKGHLPRAMAFGIDFLRKMKTKTVVLRYLQRVRKIHCTHR